LLALKECGDLLGLWDKLVVGKTRVNRRGKG
jgi:hypothetical protein